MSKEKKNKRLVTNLDKSLEELKQARSIQEKKYSKEENIDEYSFPKENMDEFDDNQFEPDLSNIYDVEVPREEDLTELAKKLDVNYTMGEIQVTDALEENSDTVHIETWLDDSGENIEWIEEEGILTEDVDPYSFDYSYYDPDNPEDYD